MSERVAIVTGAGTGVGRAAALALAADGWAVVLAGRRREGLEATAASCGAAKTLVVPTDVGRAEEVKALFAAAVSAFGRVDCVFNNAGINAPGVPLEDLPVEKWQAVV
ncbi:MAG: SDR family NAD(P)-dependent oxidoreductase, partial [Rubritepida sp.]|nr:SDR family NAD(P)-dependent oxidoreductase [Rubritepida sp.]